MRNSYAGPCYRCGLIVPPEKGHFQRFKGGWRVHHHNYGTHGGMTCERARLLAKAHKGVPNSSTPNPTIEGE